MAKAQAKFSAKSIIEPIIRIEGDTKQHALEQLFDKEDTNSLPLIKSVGFMLIPGSRNYVSYVITSQGKQVIKIEVGEPNLRAIAEDEAKIAFVTHIIDQSDF